MHELLKIYILSIIKSSYTVILIGFMAIMFEKVYGIDFYTLGLSSLMTERIDVYTSGLKYKKSVN